MNKLTANLRIKILVAVLLVIFAVIVTIHLTAYVSTRTAIEERLIVSARGVAAALAHYISMDVEPYIEFMETRNVNSPYYKHMQEYFQYVKDHGNITYIYTESRLDEHFVEFILDAEEIGSENYTPPGMLDVNIPQKEQIFQTGVVDSYRFADDSVWGDLVVSYAPIYDRDGNIISLVGADIDIRFADAQLNRIQFSLIITYFAIFLMILIIIIRHSGTFLDSMIKDKLTGVFNKKYLDKLLKEEIRVAQRDNRPEIAVMMLDLDHFKQINDTYGHEFGDKVLKAVAKTIQNTLRREDYCVRCGGEEFAVIITKADIARVSAVAERIRDAVEQLEIFNEDCGKTITLTISIGVGGMSAEIADVQGLVERSDKALRLAKADRNSVVVTTE